MAKNSTHYINNKEFYQMMVEYKEVCKQAEDQNLPKPRIPDDIGKCLYLIATRLATKWNFAGYTYREEMVGDALENLIVAVHSFDPNKSKNPLAYFTQISWYAFLRRIEKEKKQTFVKYKSLEHFIVDSASNGEDINPYANFDITNEKMKPILEKYEKKPKNKESKKIGVEKFVKDDNESSDN